MHHGKASRQHAGRESVGKMKGTEADVLSAVTWWQRTAKCGFSLNVMCRILGGLLSFISFSKTCISGHPYVTMTRI